jgi:ubiquinol-cytochrome c reductase cytochrome c1 subunit
MLTNKKNIFAVLTAAALLCVAGASFANEGGQYERANNDVANTASLQRGARNFVNYCYGCHSAQYVRFNRVATDLGISEDQVINNLMFTGERPSEQMRNAMTAASAKQWFGREPVDLSLIARSRGTDYLYTYLKSFYIDPSRPTGMNNHVLPGAAMPNVLWELQGLQKVVMVGKAGGKEGDIQVEFKGFEKVTKGTLSDEEFDQFVRDTVNFLDYIGEPMQMQRRSLGIGVMFFLLVFFGFAYFLKKEYWKDVK